MLNLRQIPTLYVIIIIILFGSCFILLNGHDIPVKNKPKQDTDHPDEEEIAIEDDDEHVDWEPVIEFPDAGGNYKERPRNGSENLQEEGHWQLHKIVNAIIHKEIQTEEMIDDFKALAVNGSRGGTFIKPYTPMKSYQEKKKEAEEKKKKEQQG